MTTEAPSKYLWAFKVLGATVVALAIWQGWTMRKYPDLDMGCTFAGVACCYAIIQVGRGKL